MQLKHIREALPELEGQGFYELLDKVYTPGELFSAKEMRVKVNFNNDGNPANIYLDCPLPGLLEH